MLLSDAIRLGAMLRPQTFGAYITGQGSCALGAAMEAAGVSSYQDVRVEWGYVLKFVPIPGATDRSCSMETVVLYLNDQERWTRGQIADWVEGWEVALGLRAIPWEVVREEEHVTSA